MSLPFTRLSTSQLALIISAFVMVVGATFAPALPATAHDQVVSASPGENESLATAPSEVSIEFTADLLDTGALINVSNANGDDVTEGEIQLEGRTVTQQLQSDMPNGQYTIVWRVVSSDGHPLTDSYQFAIGEPVTAVDDAGTAESPAEATQDAATVTSTSATSAPATDWGRIASVALLGAFAGLALFAGIFALIRRTKTKNDV